MDLFRSTIIITHPRGECKEVCDIFVTCDRIEEGYAVFAGDDGTMYDIPLSELPFEVAEGDMVSADYQNGVLTLISRDDKERAQRQERILSIFERLKNERNKKNEN